MKGCARARDLFGPYWDDETTRAEREWLDAHFAACDRCRGEYESLARTLGAVGGLARADVAPDFAERALAAARRASAAPDVVFAPAASRWAPGLAVAAAALLVVASMTPFLLRGHGSAPVASNPAPIVEPRLVASAVPSEPLPSGNEARATAAVATISDSLFDHSEDVDFVLDPVTLHKGRAHTASQLPSGIQGEQAVITF